MTGQRPFGIELGDPEPLVIDATFLGGSFDWAEPPVSVGSPFRQTPSGHWEVFSFGPPEDANAWLGLNPNDRLAALVLPRDELSAGMLIAELRQLWGHPDQ